MEYLNLALNWITGLDYAGAVKMMFYYMGFLCMMKFLGGK